MAYSSYILDDIVGTGSIEADKATALSHKFQTMCKETCKQTFDDDISQYVDFNFGNAPIMNPNTEPIGVNTTTSPGYTWTYKYGVSPMYNVVPGEPPKQSTTCTIGQYADYIDNVWNLTTDKKVDFDACPVNGHEPKDGCQKCHKPYMNLFCENPGNNYCECYG